MHLLHFLYFATSGLVIALRNGSNPSHGSLLDTSFPAIGAGDDYATSDFPATLLDDDKWYALWCKGDSLFKAMHSNDKDTGKLFRPSSDSAESKWRNYNDFKTWYWKLETDPEETKVNFLNDDDDEDFWPGQGLGPALNDLDLFTHQNDDPEKGIRVIYVAHLDRDSDVADQTYKVGAKTYRATCGYYKFRIETATGAILGLDRLAPQAAAEKLSLHVPKDALPLLQRFSDIAWLYWARHATNKHKIEYFFSVAIINEETQMAIRRALKNTNQQFDR